MNEKLEVKCPECNARFSLEEDPEDGEIFNCPECNLELVAVRNRRKLTLKSSKEQFLDEADEFELGIENEIE